MKAQVNNIPNLRSFTGICLTSLGLNSREKLKHKGSRSIDLQFEFPTVVLWNIAGLCVHLSYKKHIYVDNKGGHVKFSQSTFKLSLQPTLEYCCPVTSGLFIEVSWG